LAIGTLLILERSLLPWGQPEKADLIATARVAARTAFAPAPQLPAGQELPGPVAEKGNYTLSGPYSCENLTIFLIHGTERRAGKNFLTLQEALEQKKAVVHETRNVNELSVENLASAEEVFLQSGDIVKGGDQDRVLQYDLIVSAGSGRVPLAAFCVEQGRWQQRGQENSAAFNSADTYLASKELKLATKYEHSQHQVWSRVAGSQAKLRGSLGRDIPTASASSLQLTLEAPAVQEAVRPYLEELSSAPNGKEGVIGFAYAVNGKVNSAEVYASASLFKKLWPKLLRASAVEALAERGPGGSSLPVTMTAVSDFLADAEQGKAFLQPVTERIQQVMQETATSLLFETRDQEQAGGWIHRSYLMK
jgi:hypothetical protein